MLRNTNSNNGTFSDRVQSVCVMGAGPSGLVTCKILKQSGFDVDVFESNSEIGGIWNTENPRSAAYASMQANTSKTAMAFADFGLPESYPDFPSRAQILEYLRLYADHFKIRGNVHFNSRIERAEKEHGRWSIWLTGGQKHAKHYDAIVVCTGQFQHPDTPTFADTEDFEGHVLHAIDYLSPSAPHLLVGKRVVVVGLGTTAIDIAAELAKAGAHQVWLSARSGRYLAPKLLQGRPLDINSPHPSRPLPLVARIVPRGLAIWVSRKAIQGFYKNIAKYYGSATDLGFPEPNYLPWEKPPTITDDIRPLLRQGKIQVKPAMEAFEGQKVRFVDKTSVTADAVIYATGYRWMFPFLSEALTEVGDDAMNGERLVLERRIAHPRIPNLFFIGFCKQLCSILPLAEQQAHWLAARLAANAPPSANLTLLSEPFGTVCNFYVEHLRRDQRRWKSHVMRDEPAALAWKGVR